MGSKEEVVLIHNAKIYQSGEDDASWLTFDQNTGIILEVGTGDIPQKARIRRDVGGRRVLPGLQEAHIHMSMVGAHARSLDLCGTSSIDDLKARVKEYARTRVKDAWLKGRGWEQDVMGRMPTRQDIDEVCPDRPVMFSRACGHISLINTKALTILGIDRNTPDPPGGAIDRFPEGHPLAGEPTGVFREKACDVTSSYIRPDDQEMLKCIKTGIDVCLRNGVTSVHSNEPAVWHLFSQLAEKDQLPIRVFFACYFNERDSPNFPKPGDSKGEMLSCDRIKLFADGSMGASTAAISLPYVGTDDQYGLLLNTQEEFDKLVAEANAKGFRLEIHVIGDRAAEMAIVSMERAKVSSDMRPLLTHSQILRDDLIDRMKTLGVVANIQPQFVTTDSTWIHERINSRLMPWAYAWKSLLNRGIPCAGGSDAPVELAEPMLGIYDAIFRQVGKRGPDAKVFRPEECLNVREAIDLYTKGGAYATKKEAELGQLKPGFKADFVVLDSEKDVCTHPEQFLTAKAAEVWVNGKLRYSNIQALS